MKVLGKGHQGVVIAGPTGIVKKFYKTHDEWEHEKDNLAFLAEMQARGFSIGCTIPEFLMTYGQGSWDIEGGTYSYCSEMERLPGVSAKQNFTDNKPKAWATAFGTIIFTLHTTSQPHIQAWVERFGENDGLLRHVLEDKAVKVTKEGTNHTVRQQVEQAAHYLEKELLRHDGERVLSHFDISPSNVIIDSQNNITGLVDWGSFGLTHPTLSLYQLVGRSRLWESFEKQYKKLGGAIRDDILYAAAAIHLAWAPIICRELGLPTEEYETRQRFEELYQLFLTAKKET